MKKIILLLILIAMCVSVWGADLSKTGITDAGTIEAVHITRLYDTLTGDSTYDNVKTLLGNIKEYTAHTVFVDGSNWTTTELVNTTDASGVTISLSDQNNKEDIYVIFTGYTLPAIEKIFVTVKLGATWILENEQIWFAPLRNSDTQLILKMYKSSFLEFNHAGGDISENSNLWIRILFYP